MRWELYIISVVILLVVCVIIYWIVTSVMSMKSKIPRYLSVRVATTDEIDLQKTHSMIDNIILNLNDRILVKNQSQIYQNGIYELNQSYRLVRSKDMRYPNQVYIGAFIYVREGLKNCKTSWLLNIDHNYFMEFPEIYFTNVINIQGYKKGLALYYTQDGIYEWNELPKKNIEPIDFNITMNLKQQHDKNNNKIFSAGSIIVPINNNVQLGEYRCIVYTDNRDWCCTSMYIINSSLFTVYEDSYVANSYENNLRIHKSHNNKLKIRYLVPNNNIKSIKLSVRFIPV